MSSKRFSDVAGPAPARPIAPAALDRQPPQDLAAEQSVLGGMLMSKDAIADVIEALRSGDFYKPAHTLVFDAVLNLYSRGEPADAITVASELDKAGSLSRVGGAVYLHTLMATVPTAANAGFYAQIVAEKAILRRLVEAGTRIVQLGYGGNEGDVGGGEVEEIVDRAQAEIYDVTERRTSEDYVVLEELLQPTMDEIDAIAMAGGRAAAHRLVTPQTDRGRPKHTQNASSTSTTAVRQPDQEQPGVASPTDTRASHFPVPRRREARLKN